MDPVCYNGQEERDADGIEGAQAGGRAQVEVCQGICEKIEAGGRCELRVPDVKGAAAVSLCLRNVKELILSRMSDSFDAGIYIRKSETDQIGLWNYAIDVVGSGGDCEREQAEACGQGVHWRDYLELSRAAAVVGGLDSSHRDDATKKRVSALASNTKLQQQRHRPINHRQISHQSLDDRISGCSHGRRSIPFPHRRRPTHSIRGLVSRRKRVNRHRSPPAPGRPQLDICASNDPKTTCSSPVANLQLSVTNLQLLIRHRDTFVRSTRPSAPRSQSGLPWFLRSRNAAILSRHPG